MPSSVSEPSERTRLAAGGSSLASACEDDDEEVGRRWNCADCERSDPTYPRGFSTSVGAYLDGSRVVKEQRRGVIVTRPSVSSAINRVSRRFLVSVSPSPGAQSYTLDLARRFLVSRAR